MTNDTMNVTKAELIREMTSLFHTCEGNIIDEAIALEGCEGLQIYEDPIFGFADASDALFLEYKKPEVIGDVFMLPEEWLPGASTVISFFLPFSERVRKSNRGEPEVISSEWLHARIEGQALLNQYTQKLKSFFTEKDIDACVPAMDERFRISGSMMGEGDPEGIHYASAWSERHVAYAAGLGTFCLSRGLISEKGVAGRYGSIIVAADYEPDQRAYDGIYDNCIECGACIKRCPVNAISLEHGKNQAICRQWVEDHTGVVYKPRYGCGKCQVGVPCEHRNPAKSVQAGDQ